MAISQDDVSAHATGHAVNQNTDNIPHGNATHGSPQVLVVGGGPVGCVTALKLAQAGIDVAIIERQSSTSDSPRAVGYYGATQIFLNEIGLYKPIREAGFMTRGLCWRKKPTDDGVGGKSLGQMLACQPLCAPDETVFEVGAGLLNLPQADLNKLFLREALKTGHVTINFNTQFVSILRNNEDGVVVQARNTETNDEQQYHAKYLVAADGATSVTRKALDIPFSGHTWPERLISTNVYIPNGPGEVWPTHYVLDRIHYTIATPLQEPVEGKTTLWRYSIAANPDDTRPDAELMTDGEILQHYENMMSGPRPLQATIQERAVYRIHQRLAPTMRKGNCLLAGDAAHACNVSNSSPASSSCGCFSRVVPPFPLHPAHIHDAKKVSF